MTDTEINKTEEAVGTETKRKRKPLTKKQRIILIVVVSVVSALIIAGAITAAVLLTRDKEQESYETPSRRMQYSYYIDKEDREGFYLDQSFRAGVPLSNLTRSETFAANGVVLDDDLRLHVTEDVANQAYAQYIFSYKDSEIAVINISVTTIEAKIASVPDLLSINRSGVYALTEDIDLSNISSVVSLESFSGVIYGNHHKIKGLASERGLFGTLNGAKIVGLDFEDVQVNAVVGSGRYGVIAGAVNNSEISYCTVKGSFKINAPMSETLYVGGIAGMIDANKRADEAFSNEKKILQCVSYLNIEVAAAGDIKVGGIAGGIKNATIRDSYAYGKTSVTVAEGSRLSGGIYLGGIAGIIHKEYDGPIDAFKNLDEGSRLYSYSALALTVNGDNVGVPVYVGGIVGKLDNHSVANVKFGGTVSVRTGKVGSYVGGIVGGAENTTSMRMSLRGIEVDGKIDIYSIHNVYAGGIAGLFDGNVVYEKVNGSVMPEIETDTSVNTGLHTRNTAVALTK